jgi:uncharacterized membrane protein YecN with MAPEG domain
MQFPTTTAFLAAFFAVLLVALSLLTSLRRSQLRVSYGDGNDEALRRRMRAHGNFVEYAPMAVVVAGLVEISGASHLNAFAIALALGLARLMHAAGMLFTSRPALRAAAMLLQHAAFLFGATVLLKRVLYAG